MNKEEYMNPEELISLAIDRELERSMEKYEHNFHTAHEAESVIREEIEEAEEELADLRVKFDILHSAMRNNYRSQFKAAASSVRASAFRLAYEAVQVAAMSVKSTFDILDEE